MRFQCPFCSYNMRGITQSMLSRKVRCPDCDKTSRLPKDQYAEGRIIGDFILKRQLGVGSIGAVFFAHQISLDRAVALKVLSKEYSNTKGIEAFLKEARAAAKLSHANLVQSFGVGEEEGTCFMAMNFIEGETVKDKIEREGRIKVDEALHIVQQVAEGLYYAWTESGLIHRDVKPENIMLTKEGAVKLTDLGLAMAETEWHEDMEISGSPSYMSPEQFTGEKIDTRSDVYSLGISLYQMLSGELPFRGETLKTVAKQHFYEASKPLSKVDPMIPAKVNQLVQKMIAKEPDKRFQNMEKLISDIWEVRQTTAPDKDLVPSVHTISIKRLDYELQEISEKRKKHVKKENQIVKEKSDNLKKVLFITIPIFVAIAVLFLILHINTQSSNRDMETKVNAFSQLMSDDAYEVSDLKQEWEHAKNSMADPQSDYQQELHTRMDLYLEQLRNKDLRELNKKLAKTTESTAEKNTKELEELLRQNEETAKLLEQKQAELEKKEELFKEKEELFKKRIKQQANKTSNIKNKLGKSAEELKEINEKRWKDEIRLKASYGLVSKRKFNEAEVVVKIEEEDHPGHNKWFEKKYQEIKDLDTLYNALTMSGSKYADIVINEGRIKSIIGDEVRYTTIDDKVVEEEWYKLDPESHLIIAEKVFPEYKEPQLRAYLLIISGKIVDASEIFNDSEIKAICEAVCEYKMKNIRRVNLLDVSKAKDDAREFLKELAASEDLAEKYRSKLKKLFTGE